MAAYSGSECDSCVEVAYRTDAVHVRDSEETDGPRFSVSASTWGDFIAYAAV
ncbi:DUF397 domain-containing protein [Streptomyces flaveus]|uniref:DUF397 domain-containing protein n=1 Tax=Streptomyces flaveus TaxID=66370 RepID=UPI0033171694